MELTKLQLGVLAAAYFDSTYGNGMFRTYEPNCSCDICGAANQLMRDRLATPRHIHKAGSFSIELTEAGEEVFAAHPLVEIVNMLDELDWFILAEYFIRFLSLADLCQFIVHDRECYRGEALKRYTELAHEGLCDVI